MSSPRVWVVGTVDTKSAEIDFLRTQIHAAGGQALVMDVGVLAQGQLVPDITNAQVAAAAS